MQSNHFLYRLFYLLLATFLIGRVIFMLYNIAFCDYTFWQVVQCCWYGFWQDIVVTSLSLAVPGLLMLLGVRRLRRWLTPYYFLMSFVLVVLITADTVMYEYWHFNLNAVILSYAAYPEGATSSVPLYYLVSRIGCGILGSIALALLCIRLTPKTSQQPRRSLRQPGSLPFCVFFCFCLIASQVEVGTAYWSPRLFLNHSAVNPVYGFFSSFHTRPYHERYVSMDDAACAARFRGLYDVGGETTDSLLRTRRPDILIVLMESFGSPFVESLGGAPVDANLERLIPEGVYWEQYYSNSFRTDRAIVSTFSGWISYPDVGLMTHPEVHDSLPSLARTLASAGYSTEYLYHGPMTNMGFGAFLSDIGFQHLYDHTAFPDVPFDSPWGVHDREAAEEVATLLAKPAPQPRFMVWQTISSHEPWEVPWQQFDDPVENAFSYTDAALGDLVDSLKQTPIWDNLLLIVIPDHGHHHHQSYEDEAYFHAPMLWIGGAVRQPRRMPVLMNQSDLAATLLGQLGIAHADFPWSRNVLASGYRYPFVYCAFPSGFLFRDATGSTIYDTSADRLIFQQDARSSAHYGPDAPSSILGRLRLEHGKTILQTSYDRLWTNMHR